VCPRANCRCACSSNSSTGSRKRYSPRRRFLSPQPTLTSLSPLHSGGG
jgi:hypothetical protein